MYTECQLRRNLPRCLVVFLCLISFAPLAFARGSQEDSLSKADQLIAERRYNDAILALTAFIKEEPERFDDAQKRLQRIVRLRDEYNLLAEELLNVLVNDPTNDERKLSMISRLEELEAAPNRAAREFILRTKETALFTYNRAQFEAIMADGRQLIDEQQYTAAARRYTDGFVLYREEFYQENYGPLVVSRVDAGLAEIDQTLVEFEGLYDRLIASIELFKQSAATSRGKASLNSYSSAFQAVEDLVLAYAAVRNRIAAVGRSFENQFLLLQGADETLGDSSFLPFAFRFILGRRTEVRPEGILGTLDTYWTEALNQVQAAAGEAAERHYTAAIDASRSTAQDSTREAFVDTASYADIAMRSVGFWSALAGAELSPALTSFGRSIVSGKVPDFLNYQTMIIAAAYQRDGQSLRMELDELAEPSAESFSAWQVSRTEMDVVLQYEEQFRTELAAIRNRAESTLQALESEFDKLIELHADQLAVDPALVYLEDARNFYTRLFDALQEENTESSLRSYTVYNTELQKATELYEEQYEEAVYLLEGYEVQPEGAASYTGRYPGESVPLLGAAEASINEELAETDRLLERYAQEQGSLAQNEEFITLSAQAAAARERLAALLSEVRQASSLAQDRVQQAESLLTEAERYYREAESALARLDFNTARDRLQRSGERYDASLAIQDSTLIRQERDSRLLALSADISRIENEIVVRDVRRLITQAKSDYFSGVFEQAEDALLQAQLRWRTTNVEDEPEISYWLTLVRGALSIQTGRSIPITAPLYPEMSQLLSAANKYYEEGRSLLNQNKRSQALEKFAEAKEMIQDVRIVFPINQQASLLDLRIDQLIDPDAFTVEFRRRFEQAQQNLQTQPQEAYSDLQDLAEINPRYPGIQAAIERAEIQLGLRLPPPDPAALRRSNELVRSASRIVDENIRAQFPAALEQLNEALRLNPNNEQAGLLKDKIQTDVGGQASVVLSSAAEREYQRAVQEYQQGNTIVALSIVEQLLQDPRNRNSNRILELQRRIQSRL